MIEITCDKCGASFESGDIAIKSNVIGYDEDGDVIEKYYDCPVCGEKYTITIMDRQQVLLIQKRKEMRRRIAHQKNCGRPDRVRKYIQKEKDLADAIKSRAEKSKEEYGGER